MAYSTIGDVRATLTADGDPADEEAPNPTPDAHFTDAIAQADGEVNLYLGSRYAVPVTGSPAPEPVRTWSRVVAAWFIYLSWHKGQPIDANDPMRLRYAGVLATLQAVNAGTLEIPGLDPAPVPAVALGPVNQYDGQLWPSSVLVPADDGLAAPGGLEPVWPWRYG